MAYLAAEAELLHCAARGVESLVDIDVKITNAEDRRDWWKTAKTERGLYLTELID